MDKKFKVLAPFNGISCGRVSLERANIEVERYVSYEIDENANKVAKFNYPNDEYCGDVFQADFTQYKGFDLLIGGSPCTYWSIARTSGDRETTSSGFGFELFMQYVRALKESNPTYFIYENNFSISNDIKNEISKQLNVKPIMINSELVSGQSRKRMYWTNIPNVEQPNDRCIVLQNVIDFSSEDFRPIGGWCLKKWCETSKDIKLNSLKTINSKKSHTLTTSKTHPMNYYLSDDKKTYCNLTVNDWEKLQTLPIGYVDNVNIKQGAKYKSIGNGWTIDVIAHILSYIN